MDQVRAVAFEVPLNNRECMRAEIVQRKKPVVVLSRRKKVDGAYQRTGKVLEFAEHHLDSVLDLLGHLQVTPKNLTQDGSACAYVTGGRGTKLDYGCDSACWGREKHRHSRPLLRSSLKKLGDAETTTPRPQCKMPKRRRGGGRHRSLTPEQIETGINILRNQPIMTVEAAHATLCSAGINGSFSAMYRLVIRPAYASGF